MRVVAVAGSSRRGDNSDTLLGAALELLRERGAEVETIVPRQLDIRPCAACGGCWDTGVCVVKDGMQDLYRRFIEADHLVVASPLYFASVPGHLKVLIDRFQCYWVRTFRLHDPPQPRRTGMFLAVGAMDRERYYRCAGSVVKSWMATLNVKCTVTRHYTGLDARDDVTGRPEMIEDARRAAEELLGSAPE